MLRPAVFSPAFRQVLRLSNPGQSRSVATKVPLKNTMDDLPVPSGSWETHYKAQQSKYNMHLAFGVIFASVTFVVARASGAFRLYGDIPQLGD